MVDLSIIIVSYNTAQITKKCLQTIVLGLEEASFKYEIVVLDNDSTDNSIAMLHEFKKQHSSLSIKIVESKENLGFGKGNNAAVKQAMGKHLLFLNSDTEILGARAEIPLRQMADRNDKGIAETDGVDSISSLYSFFTSDLNIYSFVGPKLLEKDGKTPQASAGHFYTLPVVFAALFLRGDYYGLTRFSPRFTKQVDWVSGACFMCAKSDFEMLGGFDEAIFMYMEEIDLLYRAKKHNLLTGFYPNSRIIHLGSASSNGRSEPIIQVFKGFLYFYKKHNSRLQLHVLRIMLQFKALVSITIGKIINSSYLSKTYAQAYGITKNN